MLDKSRTLLSAAVLTGALVFAGCGGGGSPPVCTACQYGTASYVISEQQLQGGTIVAANMHTEVDHTSCPYGGSTAACTATLVINVACATTGAGSFVIERRPNGLVHGSTNQPSNVNVVVQLPGGRSVTVPVPVDFVPGTSPTAVSPCPGGSTTPTIEY